MKENCRCVDSWTVLEGSTGQGRVRVVYEEIIFDLPFGFPINNIISL